MAEGCAWRPWISACAGMTDETENGRSGLLALERTGTADDEVRGDAYAAE